MTNDPSMTITSTIPAPEVSDSTSREGKTIPLPVTEGSNAPPAPDAPPPALVHDDHGLPGAQGAADEVVLHVHNDQNIHISNLQILL